LGVTGPVPGSARTWSMSVMPSGSWTDAQAACEALQKLHPLRQDT
jgi:hypothetical protein